MYGLSRRQAEARVFPFDFNAQWIQARESYVVHFPAWAPLILLLGLSDDPITTPCGGLRHP